MIRALGTAVLAALLAATGCTGSAAATRIDEPRLVDTNDVDGSGEPPEDLALADPTSPDPAVDYLSEVLDLSRTEGTCILDAVADRLPPGDFATVRFAGLYTVDRQVLADAVAGCVQAPAVAAALIADDPSLTACIAASASVRSASSMAAAVAALGVEDVTRTWREWIPESAGCPLLAGPDPVDGEPEGDGDGIRPVGDDLLGPMLALPPPGFSYSALAAGSAGLGLISREIVGDLDTSAFEVIREGSSGPDALVWVIAWDPDDAAEEILASGWIDWISSQHSVTTDETAQGVVVDRLEDEAGSVGILYREDGLAMLVADSGGGVATVEAIVLAVHTLFR